MPQTAGYIRVSSRQQRDETDSVANQEARLRAAGATTIYRDLAVSGFKLDQRRNAVGFRDLCAAIAAGKVNRLLVTRLDRAARRDSIVLELAELCDKHGCDFLALGSGAVDTSTAAGWLSVKMQLLVSEHFSRQLSENIRAGKAATIARGVPGRPASTLPYHLQREPGTRHGVIPSPAWADARHGIERLLAQEWRLGDLAAYIYERHGRLKHAASAGRWIRSRTLTGDATDRNGRVVVAGCWPAIATPSEQDRLVAIAEASRSRWGSVSRLPPRALSGLCRCSVCDSPLTYQAVSKYTYLRCTAGKACPVSGRHVNADAIEQELVGIWLLPRVDDLIALKMPTASPDVAAWQRELRFRRRTPEEYLLPAERERISELSRLIADADRPAAIDSAKYAALALRLSDATLSAHGWLATPPMERNADLRMILKTVTVDLARKCVAHVTWC